MQSVQSDNLAQQAQVGHKM